MEHRRGILLVEDHPLMREGIKSMVGDYGDFRVLAEAGTLAAAKEMISLAGIDLVLLDLTLPDGSGLELLKENRSKFPCIKFVVLTMHNEAPYLSSAIGLGADGYVVKDMAPEKLIFTLKNVLAGEQCFFVSKTETAAEAQPSGGGRQALSAREEKVMHLLVEGKSLTEIANELELSVKTVFTYRVRLLKKLGLKNNAELIKHQTERMLRGR